ncbi:MotA/TolQ/ExbB proton channel family protein [Kiritimatiella glycovorans]|uniref:Biopolymer transport protein ExbB n=1 Tax=Kiritimatiella glycovorans TaxID=1307763 RepID=A0A0G3EIV4_9BACT|nr:MotA/TolQ/ExbB proton channel family protein [Kiritimatiella glycovorans]AKJ64099.1 Biopolymer transport protein ExbB [Kiritimatiella glycovorans]
MYKTKDTRRMTKAFFAVMALVLFAAAAAWAQEEGAAAEDPEKMLTLWDMIKAGGWAMVPLLLCSLATVTFIVQNALVLSEKKMLRPDLVPGLKRKMADKDLAGVKEVCSSERSLLTDVLGAGLERCGGADDLEMENVKEAIDEAGTEQMATYMKPINYLSIIGAVSPMLGLLGTVIGMVKAFQTIGTQGMGRPEMLAANIGEALITTATGLIIAIPAMLFYFFFRNNFTKYMATMGRTVGGMLDALCTGRVPEEEGLEEAAAEGETETA